MKIKVCMYSDTAGIFENTASCFIELPAVPRRGEIVYLSTQALVEMEKAVEAGGTEEVKRYPDAIWGTIEERNEPKQVSFDDYITVLKVAYDVENNLPMIVLYNNDEVD